MPNAIVSNEQVWLVHNSYIIGKHEVTDKRNKTDYRYGRIQMRPVRLDAKYIGRRVKINIELIPEEEKENGRYEQKDSTERTVEPRGKQATLRRINNTSTGRGRLFN